MADRPQLVRPTRKKSKDAHPDDRKNGETDHPSIFGNKASGRNATPEVLTRVYKLEPNNEQFEAGVREIVVCRTVRPHVGGSTQDNFFLGEGRRLISVGRHIRDVDGTRVRETHEPDAFLESVAFAHLRRLEGREG